MLVLSRKVGERIRINDDIEITIVKVAGDRVRVGVSAPKEVIVHRGEIYEAIQKEKASAETTEA